MKNGEVIARIHSYSTQSATQVDVYDCGKLIHQRKATGYGYDKYTAALSGCVIEGHKIPDHCEIPGKSSGLRFLEDLGYTIINAGI